MQGVNKAIIVGTVTRDPQQGGQIGSSGHYCNFSLATNRKWNDKSSGQKREETEFHDCVAWGKLADIFMQHIQKGSNLFVEGRIKTRKYQKNGVDQRRTEIIVEQFTFLPDNQRRGVASGATNGQRVQTHNSQRQPQYDRRAGDDDIPF